MGFLKRTIFRAMALLGVEVSRVRTDSLPWRPEGPGPKISSIPGMIPVSQARSYFWLAYAQSAIGDVIEIGCWQGRSTVALAAACKASGNGIVHAIDHFRGNTGKENLYFVDSRDSNELKSKFLANISRQQVSDYVELHHSAVENVSLSAPIRMLVIDGDHSSRAVLSNFRKFRPLLVSGALVIFDDYDERDSQGVVSAVQKICETETEARLVIFGRMAVLKLARE